MQIDSIPIPAGTQNARANFFISTRITKPDPALYSSQFQASLTTRFNRDRFYCLYVYTPEELVVRISRILQNKEARIGNIWFDSHGHFSRRRSQFEIGFTEISYLTIKDSTIMNPLRELASYCDSQTVIGIGSCYGGATYTLPAIEDFPEARMNGDSLMMALSQILNNATVYASESFVMTRPGMFFGKYSLAGLPTRKKFSDPIYKPVWEHVGVWNCYQGSTDSFHRVKTVCLNGRGTISSKEVDFTSLKKTKKKQAKKMAKLKKGNYNMASMYQERI